MRIGIPNPHILEVSRLLTGGELNRVKPVYYKSHSSLYTNSGKISLSGTWQDAGRHLPAERITPAGRLSGDLGSGPRSAPVKYDL